MNKIEIIPAILPRDFGEIEEKIQHILGQAKTVQIDICDGHFVPNATWPYRKEDDNFARMLTEDKGMPNWDEIDYEFDLMVKKPIEVIEDWVKVGASRIIIHVESEGVDTAIASLKDRVEIGLALNVETPIEIIEKYKNDIGFVQCMGIDRIGFQGQEFDNKVIEKIKEIRTKYSDIIISIDGGVSFENAKNLIDTGANRLVVGSAIFEAENPTLEMNKFEEMV